MSDAVSDNLPKVEVKPIVEKIPEVKVKEISTKVKITKVVKKIVKGKKK
jgi:hypothetical protein